MKRTPLKRVTPLRRKAMRRSRPVHVSGIPADVRDAVRLRDNGHCVRCGAWLANVPASIHHRLPRGRGGDARLSGLLSLCGDGVLGCHGDVESQRAHAYTEGYLIHTGINPERVAVLTWQGFRHYLNDGSVLTRDEYREQAS